MRKSYLAASVLTLAMMSFSPAAFAGCATGSSCNSWTSVGSGQTTLAGGHYGSSHSYGGIAPCPAGTQPSSDGTCLMTGSGSLYGGSSYSGSTYGSSSYGSSNQSSITYGGPSSSSSYHSSSSYSAPSTTTSYSSSSSSSVPSYSSSSSYSSSPSSSYNYSVPLNSYRSHTSYSSRGAIATMSDSEADYKYGSGSISETYTDGSNTIVPFTTTSATLSNYRVPGMGANEFLSPTKCPVSVYNPEGAQVLGCYAVSKPAPVRVHVPTYHQVRIVRPVIYVHYPVLMASPVCRPNTRYGAHWPRNRCGW